MPIQHFLLALIVIAIWGCNFIFVTLSLQELPPLFLCAIRFLLASFPFVFFIKPPAVPFKLTMLYGLLMFGAQFALLFIGMALGVTAGLASILIQVQVFCSIFLAALLMGEIPNIWQIVGALISFLGIGLVALHVDKTLSLSGLILVILAAIVCGLGNLVTKKIGSVNMIALVVWGSFVAFWPLLIFSLFFEGWHQDINCLHHLTLIGIGSVLYIVYASTWVGYGIWNWLVAKHNMANVAPFTLLVPVVAMLSSVFVLGESFQLWKLMAGLLVITGLGINLLVPRLLIKTAINPVASK